MQVLIPADTIVMAVARDRAGRTSSGQVPLLTRASPRHIGWRT
jgi:hypothetical protein